MVSVNDFSGAHYVIAAILVNFRSDFGYLFISRCEYIFLWIHAITKIVSETLLTALSITDNTSNVILIKDDNYASVILGTS